jgi:hypothetical protein
VGAIFTHGAGTLILLWVSWLIVMGIRTGERVSFLDATAQSLLVVSGLMDAYFLIQVVVFGHTAPLGRRDQSWFGDVMQLFFALPIVLLFVSAVLRARKQARST